MSKKQQATKNEQQAEKKQPTELKDEQLDEVQGGLNYEKIKWATRENKAFTPDKADP